MYTKNIGNNIRLLRTSAGLRISIIAEYLGVDRDLISEIEKGKENISSDMLEKLACLYCMPVDAIVHDNIDPSAVLDNFGIIDPTAEELRAISDINGIALNSEFMASIQS